MKWNPDYTYKVRGTWASRRGEQIIVFNLPNAVPVMLIPADDDGGESRYARRNGKMILAMSFTNTR